MSIFDKKISVNVIKIIFFSTLILVVILLYLFWNTDSETDPKPFSILSGLLTGFIVGLFQLMLSWYEHKKIKKFEDLKIKDVMANRDNRVFYENFIKKATKEINVMGVTASRFVDHFADINSDRPESRSLITAMSKNVKVKILLPDPAYLKGEEKRISEEKTKGVLEELKRTNPGKFEFKYYSHEPAHSIFTSDDECILGPVFPKVSSKDTPAIHTFNDSPFAKRYLDYFENEWKQAT